MSADQHAAALRIVHEEAGRTLSKDDFDLCMRIAKRAAASDDVDTIESRDVAGDLWEASIRCDFDAFKCEVSAALRAVPSFQARVEPWMLTCFGLEIANDRIERNHRFFEEATEAVQANGMTRSEAHQLVDYTFDRPIGDLPQEIGGVMVTLAALCLASGEDMHAAGETELARINRPDMVIRIRAKQAAKPKHSPLPEASSMRPDIGNAQIDAAIVAWFHYSKEYANDDYQARMRAAFAAAGTRSVCETCNGHGMIGGPSYSQPDEGGERCPDCNAQAPSVPRALPAELTPPVRHVLSLMLWQTLPIANALRATGRHINRKTEDEQAAALHWLLGIALEHGENWEQAAARALHKLLNGKKGG